MTAHRATGVPQPSRGSSPDGQGACVEEVVETWLSGLPATATDRDRSADLVGSYRRVAESLLEHALGSGAPSDPVPDIDRPLARVAAETRRSGLSLSQTLDDFGRLGSAFVAWARARSVASDPEDVRDLLRAAEAVVRALGGVTGQLATLLQASEYRARREHASALASMTEVLSHELRNRLGAARTAAEMLVNPSVDLGGDQLERVAELVTSSVEDALLSVSDVRALAEAQGNLEAGQIRSIDLPNQIRAVMVDLEPAALDAGVALDMSYELEACRVDAARFRLILFNLIGNGIKYHDPGKDRPQVQVSAERREDGRVEMAVRDNGVGILAEELEDIFLYRSRGSGVDEVAGSGLGLAIVREAIEQIGGEISVTSEAGVGTVFTVVFSPLDDPSTSA